jgi:hypothetical protein
MPCDIICPVDAALLADGGRMSNTGGAAGILVGAGSGCFPRNPDRPKNPRCPANPELDLSRCRDDGPGGGGKAGETEICGDWRAGGSVASGDTTVPMFSMAAEDIPPR